MASKTSGALVGWRRRNFERGLFLKIQVASSPEKLAAKDFDTVILSLNDRRLRSLARDLARAADERGINLFPRRYDILHALGWRRR